MKQAGLTYLVATIKPWNVALFHERCTALPGHWHLLTDAKALNSALLAEMQPRFIFFPHWSHIVPAEIVANHECVCFHMTDLPYGRGGSPLQNLILRGHTETRLTALRMTETLDAGPVYAKRPLSLHGPAHEIYRRAAMLAYDMMADIVAEEPVPVPQRGEAVLFSRRKPAQSRLEDGLQARDLYDRIRMLDADGYPPAFLEQDGWRLEFGDAELLDGEVRARVLFRPVKNGGGND